MLHFKEEDDEIFEVQKAMEFDIPKGELKGEIVELSDGVLKENDGINMNTYAAQVESSFIEVEDVHHFWNLINTREVAGLGNQDTRKDWVQNLDDVPFDEIFILQNTNKKGEIPPDLIPIVIKNVVILQEEVGLQLTREVTHRRLKLGSIHVEQMLKIDSACTFVIMRFIEDLKHILHVIPKELQPTDAVLYEWHVKREDFILVHWETVSNMQLTHALKVHKKKRKKDSNAMMIMIIKQSKASPVTRKFRLGTEELFMAIYPETKELLYYEDKADIVKGTCFAFRRKNTCGILAVLGCTDDSLAKRVNILEFSRKLKHRGPDLSGLYQPGGFYLAHQGLAIVDPASDDPPWFFEDILSTLYDSLVLQRAFESVVIKRLMIVVPFGVLLSGRLDSSLFVAITSCYISGTKDANHFGAQLHYLCFGLEGSPDLEAANYLNIVHLELHFTIQHGIDAIVVGYSLTQAIVCDGMVMKSSHIQVHKSRWQDLIWEYLKYIHSKFADKFSSSYLENFSYPPGVYSPYSWYVSPFAPPPPPSSIQDNINFTPHSQTLGLNLNLQDFSNLESTFLVIGECICYKFTSLDPRGRGSSSGGGSVMAYVVGMDYGGDGMKKEGSMLVDTKVDLAKNVDEELKHISRKFSSSDPRGRGSYQPGSIVMAHENSEKG